MEQSVGQVQHEDQNSPRFSTEVHPDDRTERTDRAVYRIDPRTSGMELRLDPRPDDRSDRTEARLPRPTRQVRKIDQAKLSSERTDFESDRSFSFLTRLALTAGTAERTAERSENPTYQFDPILQFDHLSFSRGRILKLSEDIGHIWNTSVHEFPSSDHTDRPDHNSPRFSTEVHPDDRTERTDRAVYRIDPRTSGMELRLDPRPDDRSDRTEARLPRPTRQVRKIDQAKLSSERTDFESDRSFSFLTRLALTAGTAERTAERSENPTYQFDPILQFDHLSFSRGRILKLSEDIGHIWNTSVHEFPSSDHTDRPDHILSNTVPAECSDLRVYQSVHGKDQHADMSSVHVSVHGKGQRADMCTDMVHQLSKISTRTVHGKDQHADMSSVHGLVHGKGQRADMCTDMVHQLSKISTRTVHGKDQHTDMCGQHADICTDGQSTDSLCVLTDRHGRPACANGRPVCTEQTAHVG
ncbi:hypothetical protein IGI04_042997 [Brassica rapa subsp. trilocularis]|uniref:Uncharacterized protein n=1 Tax=Brassica rapa subsp. trilocularis TaxID=1813537 RepID=A0ABQ7KJP6_BRACM|nr:hypothetical protein IGI04_042997 [Brassica rapa subsp. trilocularis]